MIIEYLNPFSRAWARMKNILFTPFDLGKWFALGFTAFLAHLFDLSGGGGGRGNYQGKNHVDWDAFFDWPRQAHMWIAEHQFWVALIAAGLILAIAIGVLLLWLSSRGIFMFLDNVVHNRSLIGKPWRDFKDHGDSLFLWRLGLACLSVLLFIEFIVAGFLVGRGIYFHGDHLSSNLMALIGLALTGLALLLIVLLISKLLKDFVAPIMYRDGVPVLEAWRKFLPLFSEHPWAFILYIVFMIGLYILVGICIAIAGLLTCCIGFILLIIPYIGSVVMLPVSVTFRAFSLEFLEQFGEEYRIFPRAAQQSAAPENAPTPPTT